MHASPDQGSQRSWEMVIGPSVRHACLYHVARDAGRRMGTHPSGPAMIAGGEGTLKDWIQAHPDALGDAVLKRFGHDLPFLFKVASAAPWPPRCTGRQHTCAACGC